ncbi:MAG: nuclear transport factor 2 family protein [Kordiimonadaceae bacterium]|nr:nuclear transport factor 2 family protein [Kordiimonadaceae bacterium]MBO6569948.1 nuclear transport factor 2 family protein [Kordiimonadaceae bacterium]MBO6965955.1 nuclear transport factor 2 family protein [Kordiimonadaceae bacterium]
MKAEELAKAWIEGWNAGRPDEIPLAENFVHKSPFGEVRGRSKYLEWVKPLAAENVTDLRVQRLMGSDQEAVIHFIMMTPNGPVDCCDWVVCNDGQISAIHSFYDASGLDTSG